MKKGDFIRVTSDGSWSCWECCRCGQRKHYVRYEEPNDNEKCSCDDEKTK